MVLRSALEQIHSSHVNGHERHLDCYPTTSIYPFFPTPTPTPYIAPLYPPWFHSM